MWQDAMANESTLYGGMKGCGLLMERQHQESCATRKGALEAVTAFNRSRS